MFLLLYKRNTLLKHEIKISNFRFNISLKNGQFVFPCSKLILNFHFSHSSSSLLNISHIHLSICLSPKLTCAYLCVYKGYVKLTFGLGSTYGWTKYESLRKIVSALWGCLFSITLLFHIIITELLGVTMLYQRVSRILTTTNT